MEYDPTLRIILQGQLGDITVEALIQTLDQTLGILKQLDVATVRHGNPSLVWYVTGLSEGSAALDISGRPVKTRRHRPTADPVEVARTLVAGLDRLQTSDEIPDMFVAKSVRRVGSLGRILEQGATGITVIGPPPAEPGDTRPRSAHLSKDAARHGQQAGRDASRSRSSVIGRLERVDLHGRNRFGIYNSRSTRAVTCGFTSEQLPEVIAALGRRVLVDGILSRNAAGDPLRIDVDTIQPIPEDEHLPGLADVYRSDPTFTGGLGTAEFVRRVREA